jgi:peroxiredoxin
MGCSWRFDLFTGYIAKADEFKQKGVDAVVCLSVNDAFVMGAWAKKLDAEGKVHFLADGGAKFADAVGLAFDTAGFGGVRLKRSSMLVADTVTAHYLSLIHAVQVEDGVITKLNVENGGAFTDLSAAETMLKEL